MEIESNSPHYTLSYSLFAHHKAVRCVHVLDSKMLSGSIDTTCQLFSRSPNDPKFELQAPITLFDDYIYNVIVRPDNEGFIVGCKDKKIYLLDSEGNPTGMLEGHTDAINSLSFELKGPNGTPVLVSGSWDSNAIVWDLNSTALMFTLEGHRHAVAVLAYNSLAITGSQDGNLHFWSLETGKKVKSIDKAHKDIIRELTKVETGFASCSNDETIKIWSLDGAMLRVFTGHESYVFSVKTVGLDGLVSGSDDRTVRIWDQANGQQIQVIDHPNTVWHVAVDVSNNDVITACADGAIRVFTRDPKRFANEEELREFEKSCQEAKVSSNQGMTPSELEKLPSVAMTGQLKGKQDGEIRLFRNQGNAEAYLWKATEGIWEKIGDVISGNQRKYYEGDRYYEAGEYDYVFDVDIQGGLTSKMPYNEGDNPLETAEKFLAREGLGKGNLEQITSFIKKNTRGIANSSGGSSNNNKQQGKIVNKQKKTEFKYFPTSQYLTFEGMNLQGLLKKTLESNDVLKAQGSKLAMNEKEAKYMGNILEILNNPKLYYSSKLSDFELDFLRNKLLNWPTELKLSIFDLLRVYSLHAQSEVLFSGLNAGLDILTDICGVLQGKAGPNEALITLCLKVLTNLFTQNTNQNSMLKNCSIVFDSLYVVLKNYQGKPNILNALASLTLNYSIALAINFDIAEGEVRRFLEILTGVLLQATGNNGQTLKGLVGVGTLLVSSKKQYIPIVKEIAGGVLEKLALGGVDSEREKAEECLRDILENLI